MMGSPRRVLLALAAVLLGCGATPGHRGAVRPDAHAADEVRIAKGVPPLALVTREGDPRAAMAAAVATSGIAPERGAEVAVALGAIVEGRLEARGVEAVITPGWDGFRVRMLLTADAARLADAMRGALLAPVTEADVARAKRKLAALAARPMRDPAMLPIVECTGDAYAMPRAAGGTAAPAPDAAVLEAWRRAAHGIGRIAFAVAGDVRAGDDVARALARAGAWPEVTAPPEGLASNAEPPAVVYDATGEVSPGTTRAFLAVRVPRAEHAMALAAKVGEARGPLASRLGALDAPAKVRDVVAAAHPRGGCLAVTLDIAEGASAARIATAVALARQEIAVELDDAQVDPVIGRALARRAADPRDAAERAAWWTVAEPPEAEPRDARDAKAVTPARVSVVIGVVGGRDAPSEAPNAAAAEGLRSTLDRATVAWHEPVVETRSRVERGQGELWVLVGSPCGTLAEAQSDAGLGAAVALAAAPEDAGDVRVEPWIAPDGIGLIAHASAAPGEAPAAHARRVADAAARAFAADALDGARVSRARAELLRTSERDEALAFTTLADALSPGHPSWLAPLGTTDALGRSSDLSVSLHASALRAGPLRVAVLANVDAAQAEAAVRATDRWIARRPSEARACPSVVPSAPRPGTYAVDAGNGTTDVTLGVPLAADAPRAAASLVALALDGPDGLLAKALGAGLARGWSARVVGGPRAAALVVKISTVTGAADAAVAQTRALLDRLRQGALSEADRARAIAARERAELTAQLEPRARLIAAWRGDAPTGAVMTLAPALDALREFCAVALRDEALVIVALRPRPTRSM